MSCADTAEHRIWLLPRCLVSHFFKGPKGKELIFDPAVKHVFLLTFWLLQISKREGFWRCFPNWNVTNSWRLVTLLVPTPEKLLDWPRVHQQGRQGQMVCLHICAVRCADNEITAKHKWGEERCAMWPDVGSVYGLSPTGGWGKDGWVRRWRGVWTRIGGRESEGEEEWMENPESHSSGSCWPGGIRIDKNLTSQFYYWFCLLSRFSGDFQVEGRKEYKWVCSH